MKILALLIMPLSLAFANFYPPQIPAHTQKQCIEKMCNKIGTSRCQSNDEFYRLVDSCTRQLDLSCINYSLQKLSYFDSDELVELAAVAKSCQYVYPNSNYIATYSLGYFELDELNEVTSLNSSLWLATPACIDDALYNLSIFDKNDLDEVRSITSSCTGTYNSSCFANICFKGSSFACDEPSEVRSALYKCVSGPSRQDRRRL